MREMRTDGTLLAMLVEVITAAHAAYAHFLPAAWASLQRQTHPDWVWLVQIDGPDHAVRTALVECGAAEDSRVRIAMNGTREGPAITRNVALGRARAEFIQNLDADDEFETDALAALLHGLIANPDAGFAVGPARDLLSSGHSVEFPIDLPLGLLSRGAVVDAWTTEDGRNRLPAHPAGVMWRRELVLAIGGWSALRNMEDTGLLLSASALAPGVVIEQITLRYRRHRSQRSTQHSSFKGGGEQISLIAQRAATLRSGPAWAPAVMA